MGVDVNEEDIERMISVLAREIDPLPEQQRDSANTLRDLLRKDSIRSSDLRRRVEEALADYERRGGQ